MNERLDVGGASTPEQITLSSRLRIRQRLGHVSTANAFKDVSSEMQKLQKTSMFIPDFVTEVHTIVDEAFSRSADGPLTPLGSTQFSMPDKIIRQLVDTEPQQTEALILSADLTLKKIHQTSE